VPHHRAERFGVVAQAAEPGGKLLDVLCGVGHSGFLG
jgi:hypothetical protein